jgi:hypothetical protein
VDTSIDGFYSAFLTGREGSGFAVFVIRKGVVVGADVLGGTYNGGIEASTNNAYTVTLNVRTPPNIPTIQGGVTGSDGQTSDISFRLPSTFLVEPFIRIDTNNGPVNCKFVRVRGIDV